MGTHRDAGRVTTPPDRTVAGGSVVAFLPPDTRRYLGSPSLAIRPDGALVVTHDVFGADSDTSLSYVYESTDGGRAWAPIATVTGAFWSSLFVHRGELYLLGTDREYGALVIRRSTDGGRQWTDPTDQRSGRLTTTGRFHTAAVPILEHDGRLWRAYEQLTNVDNEWGHFAAGLMSAPVEADLLDAASWTLTPAVPVPETLRAAGVGSWLEGNAVHDPAGRLVNVLRAHRWDQPRQSAVVLRAGALAEPLTVDPSEPLRAMPGGGSKFTIRWDEPSGAYWSVVNTALFDASPTLGLRARNTLSLATSTDLRDWSVATVLLHHPDDARHGFQYADWLVDGEDLVVAVRTAHDQDGRDAHSYHDSNLITVHRVPAFRRFGRTG